MTAIVMRWPRNWRRIVRMKAKAGRSGSVCCGFRRLQISRSAALPIKLKSEWFAECGKGSFGRVGFSGLQGDVVNLTR